MRFNRLYLPAVAVILLSNALRAWIYWAFNAKKALGFSSGPVRWSNQELRRAKHYYWGAVYLGTLFGAARGRPLNLKERFLFTNLSALAAFFDDLTTHNREVLEKSEGPVPFGEQADERGWALYLHRRILQHLPEEKKADYNRYLQEVFEREIRKQPSPYSISNALPTGAEGASSVLLFRSLTAPVPALEERELWFAFGCYIQMVDDVFDVWIDRNDGVQSWATPLMEAGNLAEIEKRLQRQREATLLCVGALSLTTKGKKQRLLGLLQVLTALAQAALYHYRHLIAKYGALPLEQRKEMIVDMALWRNRLRVMRYLVAKDRAKPPFDKDFGIFF